MSRVIAKSPDGKVEHALELAPNKAVLLGRAPDFDLARTVPEVVDRSLDPVTVPIPSVSANHALVWSDVGHVCIRDLGSRNGTWLLLPRESTVRVEQDEVVLQLAKANVESCHADDPVTPEWRSGADFADALAESVRNWLRLHDIEAEVVRVARDASDGGPPTRIPLASGDALEIAPVSTVDAGWSRQLERLWRWVARINSIYEVEEEARREGMILASQAIRTAHREVVEAAQAGARTLLLMGATGAGKERLAEVFHRHSGRTGPFVPVDCSMFSKDLLRSELFGAEAGSFTGASRRIVGAVERAQGGTLFLDEFGEMPLDIQPMLLRFLDSREYEHIGQYGRVQRADVRVVAATNRDLRAAARKGAFRADLWYRLSVHVVEVPSLHARWDDIVAYLESVPTAGGAYSMREALSADALELLRSHPWEGNFRELTNFIERLPKNVPRGGIDAAACRRALDRGAINPLSKPPPPVRSDAAQADWAELAVRAVSAFVEDHGREPVSWDDQKEWNEKYLKPLLFFHLSGASAYNLPMDEGALSWLASQAATRVQADRGTAIKQLARFFERFRK